MNKVNINYLNKELNKRIKLKRTFQLSTGVSTALFAATIYNAVSDPTWLASPLNLENNASVLYIIISGAFAGGFMYEINDLNKEIKTLKKIKDINKD